MKKIQNKKKRLKRGIYILPNIFTSFNIFCGFYAIISAIKGSYVAAASLILIAVVFDALDGKIARATNTSSKFGIEYDSLADLISFGLAPGLLAYLWALQSFGRIGWLSAFLFLVCGALRLARFNTQTEIKSNNHFSGLPIPAGAAMIATSILFYHKFDLPVDTNNFVVLLMLYILSFLMVSTIKYNSFKGTELFIKMNFNALVAVILILVFIASQPCIAFFIIGISYVVSGPITTILHYKNSRQNKALDTIK